jgi:hypothetical protein
MYSLFERVQGIKVLCNAFRMHVQVSPPFSAPKA